MRQNVLYACYHDALTAEQLALAVGVGLPYMEDDLNELLSCGLLIRDGAGKHRTNMVLFTEDFCTEEKALLTDECRMIAERVQRFVEEQEADVRALGFTGSGMNCAAFRWQMMAMLLHHAVIGLAGQRAAPELPMDRKGRRCVCWGVESTGGGTDGDFAFGASRCGNRRGDWVQCMDFPIVGTMVHHAFNYQSATNVFLDIAAGRADCLSENDEAIAAELVRRGYVRRTEGGLSVACPVMTAEQHRALLLLMEGAAEEIAALADRILQKTAALLQEHAPAHLKETAARMAYFRLFDAGISAPAARLHAGGFLLSAAAADWLPTTYAVIAE